MSSSRAGSRGICPGTWEGRPEEAAPKSSPPQGAARRACPQRTSRGRRGDARGRQALPPPGDAPTPQSTAPQRGTVPGAPPTSLLTPRPAAASKVQILAPGLQGGNWSPEKAPHSQDSGPRVRPRVPSAMGPSGALRRPAEVHHHPGLRKVLIPKKGRRPRIALSTSRPQDLPYGAASHPIEQKDKLRPER